MYANGVSYLTDCYDDISYEYYDGEKVITGFSTIDESFEAFYEVVGCLYFSNALEDLDGFSIRIQGASLDF